MTRTLSTYIEKLSDESLVIEKRGRDGFYTDPEDPHAGRTFTPVVFLRITDTDAGWERRYFAGYDDESGGHMIDVDAAFEDPYRCMDIAYSFAQRDAEIEAEYDTMWRAGVQYAENMQEAEQHRVAAEVIKIELLARGNIGHVLTGIVENEIARRIRLCGDMREKARDLHERFAAESAFQEGRDNA